jgi:hypothetical protein
MRPTATARAAAGRPVRRSSPSPGIEREKLEITAGAEALLMHHRRPRRRREAAISGEDGLNDTRCGVCGSLLFSLVRDCKRATVVGAMAFDPGFRAAGATASGDALELRHRLMEADRVVLAGAFARAPTRRGASASSEATAGLVLCRKERHCGSREGRRVQLVPSGRL